jgi:hypothetical protein
MPVRRVFIFWTTPIFLEAVRLLLNHPRIEWVGESCDYSIHKNQVIKSNPDTILVEELEGSIPGEIMEILELKTMGMRVVGLSLDHNLMSSYYRIEQEVGEAEDLLYWILNVPTEENADDDSLQNSMD